jgi:hypothetical protein
VALAVDEPQADRKQPEPAAPWWRRGLTVLETLFPAAPAVKITRMHWIAAVVAVLAGTAVSLFRVTGTGPFQTIWEEDSRDILTDALNMSGLKAVIRPAVGYYIIFPRLLGELATLFPISWAAAVLSISSALVTALLALTVYVASAAHLSHRVPRLLAAAPILFAPVAENFLSEVYNRPVCLHFFALYTLFWVLLWTPSGRGGRWSALAIVFFTATSTVLVAGMLPLAALRVVVRRDRYGLLALLTILGGSALHYSANVRGLTSRAGINETVLDPVWALKMFGDETVPLSMLGFRWAKVLAFGPDVTTSLLGWLVVVVIVAVGAFAAWKRWTRPPWLLLTVTLLHAVALHCMMVMAGGGAAMRYVLVVELLLFAALGMLMSPAPRETADAAPAGWRPRFDRRTAPVLALAAYVLVVGAVNYRFEDTYRHNSPRWKDQIVAASELCRSEPQLQHVWIRTAPQPWYSLVYVPCHEVRGWERPCVAPTCRDLNAPPMLPPQRD